jgi:hypothetical protein
MGVSRDAVQQTSYPEAYASRRFLTRAEARRKQQQLEREAGSEQPQIVIKDKLGRIVL